MNQDSQSPDPIDNNSKRAEAPFGWQVFFGFLAYVVSMKCFASANFGWMGIITYMVVLIITAIFLYTKCHWKGFIVGILIGLGLTALVFGLCFAALHGFFLI